jgi:hypothetical protein
MNKNELIKSYILRLFSQELQYDETPTGAMERKQLTRWLLNWANEQDSSELKKELAGQ